jgi:hypothetical protein
MSRRHPLSGSIIAAGRWAYRKIRFRGALVEPAEVLHAALEGLGQPDRERCFRMNVSLCLHRGATPEEVAALPDTWHDDESGMAGGPVAVLWERGVKALTSALPCESPRHKTVIPGRPDLWIPVDCGRCAPCLARKAACG